MGEDAYAAIGNGRNRCSAGNGCENHRCAAKATLGRGSAAGRHPEGGSFSLSRIVQLFRCTGLGGDYAVDESGRDTFFAVAASAARQQVKRCRVFDLGLQLPLDLTCRPIDQCRILDGPDGQRTSGKKR